MCYTGISVLSVLYHSMNHAVYYWSLVPPPNFLGLGVMAPETTKNDTILEKHESMHKDPT